MKGSSAHNKPYTNRGKTTATTITIIIVISNANTFFFVQNNDNDLRYLSVNIVFEWRKEKKIPMDKVILFGKLYYSLYWRIIGEKNHIQNIGKKM